MDRVAELRRQPGPPRGEALPTGLLKHADEQTVAGLAAVLHAAHDHGLSGEDFRPWGVLAVPRFMGRAAMAAALQRFQAEGAWGVSPHLIPHRSLHSLSGTVSHALKIHGPNFGIGGGLEGAAEALLIAAALLERKRVPGVWVVLTALDPDLPPDPEGHYPVGVHAASLALALVSPRPLGPSVRLQLTADAVVSAPAEPAAVFDLFRLHALLGDLARFPDPAAGRTECLAGVGRLSLRVVGAPSVGTGRDGPPPQVVPGAFARTPHPASRATSGEVKR
jgi:hypothetical protein